MLVWWRLVSIPLLLIEAHRLEREEKAAAVRSRVLTAAAIPIKALETRYTFGAVSECSEVLATHVHPTVDFHRHIEP